MPAFAKKITLDEGARKMIIDGVEHPWLIGDRGVILDGDYDTKLTRVEVVFMVADLEVVEAADSVEVAV